MKHLFDGYNHILRLDRGEQLQACLQQFWQEAKPEGGWISGIGGALKAEIGYYDLDKQSYFWKTFEQPLEILSLQGTLALDDQGQPLWHLHGSFSDTECRAIGGHVKDLTVAGTLELFVHRSYQPLHRTQDPQTGLKTLDL